jgi:hypothetical protein
MRLLNAIVLDVWKDRQIEARRLRRDLESVVRLKQDRLDRVEEAFLDQLRELVALAEIELSEMVIEQLDIDSVLAFAEHVVTNAARLWMELDLVQKRRLQQILFPEELRFDGEKFGTAVTCLPFKKLDGCVGLVNQSGVPSGERYLVDTQNPWRS